MIQIIDPGHTYLIKGVGGCGDQRILFVKNRGEKYPGNSGPPHGGMQSQDLLRVLIDRTEYLNSQGSCAETEYALANLRSALGWFEFRAARCRGDHIELEHAYQLEREPTCEVCGHNKCTRGDNHERLPGTWR